MIVSADSHIIEPRDLYRDGVPARLRDRAPRVVETADLGDVWVIDGSAVPFGLGTAGAAGKPVDDVRFYGARYSDLPDGGWYRPARLADQARDGVDIEIVYPTVGMLLADHRDPDYRQHCLNAQNAWMATFCDCKRLRGIGQLALTSIEQGIAELEGFKNIGLVGALLPQYPRVGFDYDDLRFDRFWSAAEEIGLPLSFHELTSRRQSHRGPAIAAFVSIQQESMRLVASLILSGVVARHGHLRFVIAEADAGWVPHLGERLDRAYAKHRGYLNAPKLFLEPSAYLNAFWFTFGEDRQAEMYGLGDRLLWASDYPHMDSTWPRSREVIEKMRDAFGARQMRIDWMTGGNAVELYGLEAP